jgi:hypothetical protein
LLQGHKLQVLIIRNCPAHELHFPARLPFEVQNPFASIANVDLHVTLVVLRDDLAGLR